MAKKLIDEEGNPLPKNVAKQLRDIQTDKEGIKQRIEEIEEKLSKKIPDLTKRVTLLEQMLNLTIKKMELMEREAKLTSFHHSWEMSFLQNSLRR